MEKDMKKTEAFFISHDVDAEPIMVREIPEGKMIHGDEMWEKATAFVGTSNVEFVSVYYAGGRGIMLVNDNGLAEGLPLNTFATGIYAAATLRRYFEGSPKVSLPSLSPVVGRAVLFPPGSID